MFSSSNCITIGIYCDRLGIVCLVKWKTIIVGLHDKVQVSKTLPARASLTFADKAASDGSQILRQRPEN